MKFIGIKLFIKSYFYPFNTYSIRSDVTSLIPYIENFCVFFLTSPARVYSLFLMSNNQPLLRFSVLFSSLIH